MNIFFKNALLILVLCATLFVLYLLKPILMPFLVGAFLAYLGDPLVERLHHFALPRSMAALIVFILIFFGVALFFVLLIPLLQAQLTLLAQKIPAILSFIQVSVVPWLNQQAGHFNLQPMLDANQIKTLISQHWLQAGLVLADVWEAVSRSSGALVTWIVNLLLIPVVTFYLLRDWPKLLKNLEELLPRKRVKTTVALLQECNVVLSAFFRGQLLVMLALAIIYALGLSLVGLQVALLIGLIAGLLSIVPYLGFSVGLIAALLAALGQFHEGKQLLSVVLVFIIGNLAEGMLLTPWLVGDKIGLHPVAVIFAVLAGGHLFGFFGVLLALPVAAVLMVFVEHIKRRYQSSSLYG
jgi:predicted PurR-regulated permease PerM